MKKKSETHALCTLCNSAIAYANMGEAALKRHEMPSKTDKPTKHQKRAAEKDQATKALSYLHFMKATQNEAIDFTSKQSPAQEEEKVNVNNYSVQPSASANKSPQANQQSSMSESPQASGNLQLVILPRQINNLQRVNLPRQVNNLKLVNLPRQVNNLLPQVNTSRQVNLLLL